MEELYGDYPQTELQYETPFQLLVAVVLSAQTTDKQVNKVTKKLFQRVSTPQELVALWPEKFGEMIKTVWLRTSKARYLYRLAEMLIEKTQQEAESGKWKVENKELAGDKWGIHEITLSSLHSSSQWRLPVSGSRDILTWWGYRLPETIEEFLKLPGVGIKTAKVVMPILYGKHYIAVDTHVQRVAMRLGRVKTTAADQTSKKLEKLISEKQKIIAHRVIIYFGRYRCTAKNPNCGPCRLKEICLWYRKNKN